MSIFSSVKKYLGNVVFTNNTRPEATESNGLKKIYIQTLDLKEQKPLKKFNLKDTFNYLGLNWKTKESDIYWYRDTGLEEGRTYHTNNFIGSFVNAYNTHGDILLNPDDIWIMISLYFSQYVDTNAEKLRSKFVTHQGQKKLIVKENATSLDASMRMERDWENFFNQIIEQINRNTVPGVVNELVSDFSTTTKTHKLITTAIIMNSFKKYFSYSRMILSCGIGNVYFEGTRNDWVKLIGKACVLRKYDVDGKLSNYLNKIQDILDEFLNTWDNRPNIGFWNRIMATEERRVGSGGQIQTHIEGWILHFYGIYDRVDLDEVPDYSIAVPVELYNEFTNQTKQMEIKANWVSISKPNEYTYKPDIGLCVIEAKNSTSTQNY
jgi:hypothetical protein